MIKATSSKKLWRKIKIGVGIVIAISALIASLAILLPQQAQRLAAQPTEGRLDDTAVPDADILGIDWNYWQEVNSDIAAWITIPNTPIDYPIVQASADNPQYYLTHDIYKNYNIYGCLYIDNSMDIESLNVVIFGHNMGSFDNAMFSTLTNYLYGNYLAEHLTVIIQTPESNRTLSVRAATSVSPYGYDKGDCFSNVDGLRLYYESIWQDATAKCDEADVQSIAQLFTLITCDENGYRRAAVYVG
jgi:sortase B